MAWWNSSWGKKQKITLTGGSSGAQTNYQIKLTVAYDSDMKSDFSDLRFTNGAEDTLIDAWLESKTNSVSAVIWVEFPTTPANTVDQNYYMYYGNSSATSDWDGVNTFVVYNGTQTTHYVSSLGISDAGYAYRGNMQFDVESSTGTMIAFGFGDSATRFPSNSIMLESYPSDNHNRKVKVAGVEKLGVIAALSWNINTPYTYDIIWDSSGCSWYKDGTQWGTTYTGDVPTASIGMYNYFSRNTGTIHWAFIRKYAANPATYAFGSEESPSLGNPMWYYNMIRRRN